MATTTEFPPGFTPPSVTNLNSVIPSANSPSAANKQSMIEAAIARKRNAAAKNAEAERIAAAEEEEKATRLKEYHGQLNANAAKRENAKLQMIKNVNAERKAAQAANSRNIKDIIGKINSENIKKQIKSGQSVSAVSQGILLRPGDILKKGVSKDDLQYFIYIKQLEASPIRYGIPKFLAVEIDSEGFTIGKPKEYNEIILNDMEVFNPLKGGRRTHKKRKSKRKTHRKRR